MDITPDGKAVVTVGCVDSDADLDPSFFSPAEVIVWDLSGPADEDAPVIARGIIPPGDAQTCARFHPTRGAREILTSGASRVFFWTQQQEIVDASEGGGKANTTVDTPNTTPSDGASYSGVKTRTLVGYAPALDAADFKQSVGAFTTSAWASLGDGTAGSGRCVTGTEDGDLVMWDAPERSRVARADEEADEESSDVSEEGGRVPSEGGALSEGGGALSIRRRAIKIVRVNASGSAVTHVSATGGSVAGAGGARRVCAGGADGHVRFYDQKLRLVAWFDGLDAGAVAAVSFAPQRGLAVRAFHAAPREGLTAGDDDDANGDGLVPEEPPGGYASEDEEMFMGDFDAPDFVVSTTRGEVFSIRAAAFEEEGPSEAVSGARRLLRGPAGEVVALAANPRAPEVCVVGSTGAVWTWDYERRVVLAERRDKKLKPWEMPTAVAYRSDGRGVLVGTAGGALLALDPGTLAEAQAMRFGKEAVTKIVVSDDPGCTRAALADVGGCVSLFQLCGAFDAPAADGADPARAFEFIGKHRSFPPLSDGGGVRGVAFFSRRDDGGEDGEEGDAAKPPPGSGSSGSSLPRPPALELCACGGDGRLVRYDVAGSTPEGGVRVLGVADAALGGAAAGGDAAPTAMTFLPSDVAERPTLLVADDASKLRAVDCETLTSVSVVAAPPYAGKIESLSVFPKPPKAASEDARPLRTRTLAFACGEIVLGVASLPMDGDPGGADGVVAHPGAINAEATATSFDGAFVFTVGAGRSAREGAPARVINVWRVEAKEPKDDDDAPLVPAANGAEASPRTGSRSKLARFASTLAPGELRAAEEAFMAAQIRAQGEASTAARAAGLDAPAPAAELPALMRAMGYYPTEREVAEMRAELRAEAERRARRDDDENGGEKEGGEGGATVRFDRFLAMYVNRKPAGVGASFGAASDAAAEAATLRAFAALGVGEGDAIDRASLVAALASGGEPMTREELDAAAAAILGPGATAEDLIPETVDAAEFARGVLGVGGADEIEASA